MIIQPRIKGFICATAHPDGCAAHVTEQIEYVKQQQAIQGPKNVLIIGASTGYGLASRIVSMAGANANTLGVFYEKESKGKRTATAGWYNTAALEDIASQQGIYCESINGDAFSNEIKDETIAKIRQDLGKVDMVIYSLASPRRTDPETGEVYMSVLKPIGESYTNKSIDVFEETIKDVTIEPASDEEIQNTIKVMGGEDWEIWIDRLLSEDILAKDCKTIAYSYIGPEVTRPIYRDGTIGKAKIHLEETGIKLNEKLKLIGGTANVVVAKALVTQASAAIPIVPLYIAALYKVMKEEGNHEGCIEQIYRLFNTILYNPIAEVLSNQIRIDDFEMEESIQAKTLALFDKVSTETLSEVLNLTDYQQEFYRLFGFGFDKVDYSLDVEASRLIKSIQ